MPTILSNLAKSSKRVSYALLTTAVLVVLTYVFLSLAENDPNYSDMSGEESTISIFNTVFPNTLGGGIFASIALGLIISVLFFSVLNIVAFLRWTSKVDAFIKDENNPKDKSSLLATVVTVALLQIIMFLLVTPFLLAFVLPIMSVASGSPITTEGIISSVVSLIVLGVPVFLLVKGAQTITKKLKKALTKLSELNSLPLEGSYKRSVGTIVTFAVLFSFPINLLVSVALVTMPQAVVNVFQPLATVTTLVLVFVSFVMVRNFGKLAKTAELVNKD